MQEQKGDTGQYEEVGGSTILKGRGAVSNQSSRYVTTRTATVDDGWGFDPQTAADPVKTVALSDRTKTIITTNQSPDIPFAHSINPYKGCEHGCVYCFARPTHAYLDLSPGLDFETRIFYKTGVRDRLQEELCKPGYQPTPIAMGTNTDPYQPLEQQLKVTRQILEVMLECRHPVTLVTKSSAVLRDLDLWQALASQGLAKVAVSVTTLDRELKRKLEPRTASPSARLHTIEKLADAGIQVGVMAAPMIPFVNDSELEEILTRAHAAGARTASYILLRLPGEVQNIFSEWLEAHYPLVKDRVLAAIRDTRGGKLYEAKWGERMRGKGPIADLLAQRFAAVSRKLGYDHDHRAGLRTDLFQPPHRQQSLF